MMQADTKTFGTSDTSSEVNMEYELSPFADDSRFGEESGHEADKVCRNQAIVILTLKIGILVKMLL